ncbi:MAG: hypothetical protein LBD67_05595 [Candidatus Accumulibacter sp.]|jgi:hypothetical protein|nr:hypothetical protein [Accumulibacter sp.]
MFVLPEMPGMAKGIRKGRNCHEGYQRGWGLQFGGLREKILRDPLYFEAFCVSHDRTIMTGPEHQISRSCKALAK